MSLESVRCLVIDNAPGPHALACAARLRGILAVVSVASVAPYDAEGLDYSAGMGEDSVYTATPSGCFRLHS